MTGEEEFVSEELLRALSSSTIRIFLLQYMAR